MVALSDQTANDVHRVQYPEVINKRRLGWGLRVVAAEIHVVCARSRRVGR